MLEITIPTYCSLKELREKQKQKQNKTTLLSMAIFSKLLTQDDVEKRLQVPIEWMAILPPFGGLGQEVELAVVDGAGGLFWEFQLVAVEKRSIIGVPNWSLYVKPDGWLRFVRYRELKVGDKIILELQENKFRGTKYVIKAQRPFADGAARSFWIDLF